MPVAVERLAGLLKDIFKLDVIESPAAQAAFRTLDSRLDAGFAALAGATTRSAFFVAERQYGHDFEALGAGTFVLGAELQKDALAFNAIGNVLSGDGGGAGRLSGEGGGAGRGLFGELVSDIFSGQGGGSGRGQSGGGSGIQADLAALTRDLFKAGGDLETFGVDLARVGQVGSRDALAAVEARFHPDLVHAQDDFIGVSRDVLKVAHDAADIWTGGGGGSGTNADIFSGQGGGSGFTADQLDLLRGMVQTASAFGHIGDNLGKLADIFSGQGGGSGTNADIFSGQGGGSGFAALHENFSALDTSLTSLARPLAGLLVPAVHTS